MPDLGLPREPCARRARERVTLAGASFGAPLLGLGGAGARRIADASAAHASGVLPRAFCARHVFGMPRAFRLR